MPCVDGRYLPYLKCVWKVDLIWQRPQVELRRGPLRLEMDDVEVRTTSNKCASPEGV